jgi:hypothetical protein
MRVIYLILAGIGLILTVGPSFLVFFGRLPWEIHARLMAAGMVLWFVGAPLGLRRKSDIEGESDACTDG